MLKVSNLSFKDLYVSEVIPLDDIANRIFSLLKEKGIEQKEFAPLVGTSDKTISAWKKGRSSSYTKCLPRIAEVLGTTAEYLLTGDKKEPTVKDDGLSKTEWDLVLAYRAASEDDRAVVDAALRKYLPRMTEKKVM